MNIYYMGIAMAKPKASPHKAARERRAPKVFRPNLCVPLWFPLPSLAPAGLSQKKSYIEVAEGHGEMDPCGISEGSPTTALLYLSKNTFTQPV